MNTRDKIERYLKGTKTPFAVAHLANRFLVSADTIRKNLKELEREGKATYFIIKGTRYWRYQHTHYVAVPNKPGVFTPTRKSAAQRR